MAFRYRIAGCVVELPNAVPELHTVEDSIAHLTAVISDAAPRQSEVIRSFREDGFEWLRIERPLSRNGAVFVFPEIGTFEVDAASGCITVYPELGSDLGHLWHLLLDNVLPLYLAYSGSLVLHASSISIGEGDQYAVLFLGKSGAGKSSTAAGCAMSGATLLGDDFALISMVSNPPSVVPSNVGVRLWGDSASVVSSGESDVSTVESIPKVRVSIPGFVQEAPVEPVPIGALVVLGPRLEEAVQPVLEVLSPLDGYVQLLQNSFRAEVQASDAYREALDQLSGVINSVPAVRLRMPRDLASLVENCGKALDLIAGWRGAMQ